MTSTGFDTLRYARRLREVGVPEPQAEVQAELMAEAFGNNLLTVDQFADVLSARFAEQRAVFEQRFSELDARIDQRCSAIEADMQQSHTAQSARTDQQISSLQVAFEKRFGELARKQYVHTWMLGVIMVVLVLPQLHAWIRPVL